jgi:hypothetical protein
MGFLDLHHMSLRLGHPWGFKSPVVLGKKIHQIAWSFLKCEVQRTAPLVWNIQILHAKGCHSREISENIRKLVTRFKILRENPENYMQLIHKNIQTYPNPTLLLRYRSISPVVSQPGRVGPRYWSVPSVRIGCHQQKWRKTSLFFLSQNVGINHE